MKKDLIKRNFSRNAGTYDKYAHVQTVAAKKLIDLLPEDEISHVLDVGCGTGIFTKLIHDRYRKSRIKAVDISNGMIEVAKKKLPDDINFDVCDGEDMECIVDREHDGKYDLIASNAAFQWFNNLNRAIKKYSELLSDKGILVFSTFGPLTYHELSWVMKEVFNKDLLISAKSFLSKSELEAMLKKYFKKCAVKEEIIKESNKNLRNLLLKIKYSGTQGSGFNGQLFLGKEKLKKAEELYKDKYKSLDATSHLFFCKASQ